MTYRLRMMTEAIRNEVKGELAISVPAGAILSVPDKNGGGSEIVSVNWEGETVRFFAGDLRDRADLLEAETHSFTNTTHVR
jgi:hypothetical protein